MGLATNLQATALKLLTKYGQPISLVRETEGAFVPSTGAVGEVSTTNYSGVAHPSPYSIQEINGTTIKQGDVRLLIRTNTTPAVGDIAIVDDVDYRVMSVDRLKAQGLNIVYRLQLRV